MRSHLFTSFSTMLLIVNFYNHNFQNSSNAQLFDSINNVEISDLINSTQKLFINNNYSYNQTQINNATYIYNYLIEKHWTLNAIAGLIGNIVSESSLYSDIWEGGIGPGYGLVQWTPANKLINWCKSNGLDYRTISAQCARIDYEMKNKIQFIPSNMYSMNSIEYINSTDSPYKLALVFLANYERPYNPNQPQRGSQAQYWYNYFNNLNPVVNYPHKAISTSVITMKYGNNHGNLVYNGQGQPLSISRQSDFPNGSSWKSSAIRIINNQEMFQVSSDEYIPLIYTSIGFDKVITINYFPGYGVCCYDSNGNMNSESNKRFKTGTQWKFADQRIINGRIMYQVSTDEYIPKEYTQFGDGKEDYSFPAQSTSTITMKYNSNHGDLVYNSQGIPVDLNRQKSFTNGSSWICNNSRIINNQEMFQVSSDEYIPLKYTSVGYNQTIKINCASGTAILAYSSEGFQSTIYGKFTAGSAWISSTAKFINGQIMYAVSPSEYIPKKYTQLGNGF